MLDYLSYFLKRKDVEYYEYASISALSSMRLCAAARYIVYPNTAEALVECIDLCRNTGAEYRVVGRMSNILPTKQLYDGVLIKTDKINRKISADNTCKLECGVRISEAVAMMAKNNFGGAEALFHIPASVGGMVCSNAGAYGLEISDLFLCAEVYDPISGNRATLGKDCMGFGYRKSILQDKPLAILSVTLSFKPSAREQIFQEVRRLGALRRKAQPLELPSLGSIFKANCGVGAGYYIDKVGLKGACFGGASVSEKHAGFIVNTGGATPEDVCSLIDFIKERVYGVFGIELKEEVQLI